MTVEKRSDDLPKADDARTFSRDTWITERDGISKGRTARTGQTAGRMFRRKARGSFFGRSPRS